MLFISLLLSFVCNLSSPKTIVHTEIFDSQSVLLVYSDCSMAIAPLSTLAPDGTFVGGTTIIEIPGTSDRLVSRWVDAKGVEREVITDCVTMKPPDCVAQHKRMTDLMEGAYKPKGQ